MGHANMLSIAFPRQKFCTLFQVGKRLYAGVGWGALVSPRRVTCFGFFKKGKMVEKKVP